MCDEQKFHSEKPTIPVVKPLSFVFAVADKVIVLLELVRDGGSK